MSSSAAAAAAEEGALILSSINKGATIGVTYIGVAIYSIIYGITCIQTFQYYRSTRRRTDSRLLNVLVVVLWLLDSAHQAIIIHIGYYYLITNYASPEGLLKNIWSIPTEVIVNAAIACAVELFFIMRLWKLGHSHVVCAACLILTFAHLTMNLVFPIRSLFQSNLFEGAEKLKSTGLSGLGVAVVTDVTISAAMVWYLYRGKTGVRKSDDMIGRLIAVTITTGSMTTMFVVVDFIAYVAAPTEMYNLFFNFMLGKLYINSLLTSLNARPFVRGDGGTSANVNSLSLSTFRVDGPVIASSDMTSTSGCDTFEMNGISKEILGTKAMA